MSIRHLDKDKDVWRTPSKNDPMQRLKIIETLQCTDYISDNCEQQSQLREAIIREKKDFL